MRRHSRSIAQILPMNRFWPYLLLKVCCTTQTGESKMATRKSAIRREWTNKDVRELKTLARERTPARVIGRKLRRSEGAVRQKAYAVGISLSLRKRSAKKRGR